MKPADLEMKSALYQQLARVGQALGTPLPYDPNQ